MDLGNIVYIVAVIAYFIYQATRKKKDLEVPDSDHSAPQAPKKGMNFEDLLKEIRDAQKPLGPERIPEPLAPKPAPAPVVTPRVKPFYRQPVVIEADDDEARYYQGTYAASQSNPYHASKDVHSFQSAPTVKFDYDSLQSKKVNPYAELLKNPKTLKQAIVVSEILKPKYF